MPPHLLPAGGWLHGTRSGCGGPEAGAHQGRETRAQLHDGHSAHQAGTDTSPSRPCLLLVLQAGSPHLASARAPLGLTLLPVCAQRALSCTTVCRVVAVATAVHRLSVDCHSPAAGRSTRGRGIITRQPGAAYQLYDLSGWVSLCVSSHIK